MDNEIENDNSRERLNPIFFYGLYMDEDRLRAMGVEPRLAQKGRLDGYKVRLGRRGSIQRSAGGATWGVIFKLKHDEIKRLYADAGLTEYVPEAVQIEIADGEKVAALCYVTLTPANDNEVNLSYVIKLADALRKWELPISQLSDQVVLVKPRRVAFSSDSQYEEELHAYDRLLRSDGFGHPDIAELLQGRLKRLKLRT